MSNGELQTKLAGVSLSVPICIDPETTQRVIESVNQRLSEIEARSTRINTQTFALLAAYSFAADLEELRRDSKADTQELLKALDKLVDRFGRILEPPPPSERVVRIEDHR